MSRLIVVAGMTSAIGKTSNPATSACTPPAATFSNAMAPTGNGARTRSSISRVKPKSWTSGSATAWIPWKIIVLAMTPPTRSVENLPAPAPPPMPCPILGKT